MTPQLIPVCEKYEALVAGGKEDCRHASVHGLQDFLYF